MKDYRFLQQKYLINTYPNRGLTFIRGKGSYLYTEEGEKYLDMMSNYGVNILGYNNPTLNKALTTQLNLLPDLHCSFNNDTRAIASQFLIKKIGKNYRRIYWSNSGTEAVEAALKFAVIATGKKEFIACKNAYHGKTLGSLSATYGKKYREGFEPLLCDFTHIEYDNPESLEKQINEKTAAFIVEPIQGESGVRIPHRGYLTQVREICRNKDILLILDEVQTGSGRTGNFLASDYENIEADIICLGKGLAGGMPVGITITNDKIANQMTKLSHTSTFGGNPFICAGVITVLNILNESFLKQIDIKGKSFLKLLKNIKTNLIAEVRGKGLMIGVEVKDKRNEILRELQKEKVLAIPANDKVIRFLPPYIIENQHIDYTIEKLDKVLKTI